ncbi:MAG TPA: helix-turn-helix transcriptional regulator [Solirubrobacterales bacterium]|nr:helix-turn-helix transcriptional regulator [Solirubrobacterales bacterium]
MGSRSLRDPRVFDEDERPWFEALGKAITGLREARDMSQTDLAAAADLEPQWIGEIEAGAVAAPWGHLRRIARAFGMELPDLIVAGEEQE